MQDLKVYIVIQDPKTKQDVNITGNFEVLRAFLAGIGTLEIQELNAEPEGVFRLIHWLTSQRPQARSGN